MERFLLDQCETERLLFRKIEPGDFAPWVIFFEDPASFAHWKAQVVDPETECRNWFFRQASRYSLGLGGMNAAVEKASGKLVGFVGLLVQEVDDQQELEIAYSLIPEFRGRGFASEAAKYCRDHAFQNNFAQSLISIISLSNVPSQNVAVRNGMKVDKQTVYHDNDVYIYRISKVTWESR